MTTTALNRCQTTDREAARPARSDTTSLV